jgi:hypothetical protein
MHPAKGSFYSSNGESGHRRGFKVGARVVRSMLKFRQ